uniref:Putative secreted protein n=1 Tax=Ixodes ricinus TaxID=34613 RepID=A0A6B0U4Z9_IXORI
MCRPLNKAFFFFFFVLEVDLSGCTWIQITAFAKALRTSSTLVFCRFVFFFSPVVLNKGVSTKSNFLACSPALKRNEL